MLKNWKVVSITPGDGLGGGSATLGLTQEEAEALAARMRETQRGSHYAREMDHRDLDPPKAKVYHKGRWRTK